MLRNLGSWRRASKRAPCVALGFLTLTAASEGRAARTDRVMILHDDSGLPLPSCNHCVYTNVRTAGDAPPRLEGLILTGHSSYGSYLGLDASSLAKIIARLAPEPEFLVLDTCYGAQAELIVELAKAGVRPAMTFGVADYVPTTGLDYGNLLQGQGVSLEAMVDRLRCSQDRFPAQTLVKVSEDALAQLPAVIASTQDRAARCELLGQFISVMPNLVPVNAPSVEGAILVHVDPDHVPTHCFDESGTDVRPDNAWLRRDSPIWLIVAGFLLLLCGLVRRCRP